MATYSTLKVHAQCPQGMCFFGTLVCLFRNLVHTFYMYLYSKGNPLGISRGKTWLCATAAVFRNTRVA